MLLIDDRENPKVIDKILMRMGDAKLDSKGQARVLRMKSSDYRMGDWGIEAKDKRPVSLYLRFREKQDYR